MIVAREGFEPPYPKEEIYSLPHLAALPTRQVLLTSKLYHIVFKKTTFIFNIKLLFSQRASWTLLICSAKIARSMGEI